MKSKDSTKEVYSHKAVEDKWQKKWAQEGLYEPNITQAKNKFYNLWMFPYPSAEGLHAGHAFASTGSDVIGRYMRMNGKSVFQPIGYDSFGIHSENFAIKIGETPQKMLGRTTKHYEEQLRSLGHGYDWTRTVTTSDVDYYKWTQWLFVEMFKAGLAYKAKSMVNWCPSCKTVLADEQVMTPAQAGKIPQGYDKLEDVPEGLRVCERCGTIVEKKELEQWFLRITDYAQRLLDNLEKIDWSPRVVIAQKEWIGRKDGINIMYEVKGADEKITVFTTTPVNFGATFLVVAPEHPFVEKILSGDIETDKESYLDVKKYVENSIKKTEQQRKIEAKDKTGVFTGLYAINHVTGKEIPIWVTDFVLMGVGTGAVQGCPGHDIRDFEFAKKYKIPIVRVATSKDGDKSDIERPEQVVSGDGAGVMINSDFLDGLAFGEAMDRTMDYFEEKGWGKRVTTYHLRDWLISRQRYWGPPIPMIYCENCARTGTSWLSLNKPVIHTDYTNWDHAGWYPEEKLPVELPIIDDYQPKGTGSGPLANHPSFYKVTCPHCKGDAKRETDVSDTFVDSSWYFLRYPSVGLKNAEDVAFDTDTTNKWLPVDLYFGGAEHAVLHLMYARFVTMVLRDLNKLTFEEPFPKFFAHGLMIKDGAKMSKSRGNVVNPDEYVHKFGADTLRLYLMFMGPMDGYPDFRDTGIEGMQRFVRRLWDTIIKGKDGAKPNRELDVKTHQTIKKVSHDVSTFNYNTAISAIMEYVNALRAAKEYSQEHVRVLAQLSAPFVPHLAEEAWEMLGEKFSIHTSTWPKFNEALTLELSQTIVIQINGKLKGQVTVEREKSQDKRYVEGLAKKEPKVSEFLKTVKIKDTIFVPGRLINFVTS